MSAKILKKFQAKEEKLLDAIYELQEFLDTPEDEELSSMGSEFAEIVLDFLYNNDQVTLNDIKTFVEETLE